MADLGEGAARSPWAILAVLTAGTYASFLNFSLLSPLLPAISADLSAPTAVVGQLASVGALVAFATAVAATPWMDRFSRRSWLQTEAALLAAGTLLTALAPTLAWLVVGRVVAGLGAATIGANCLAAVREAFAADVVLRNRAVGVLVSASMVAFITGLPLLALVESIAHWRWAVVVLLVPAGVLLAGVSVLPAQAPVGVGPAAGMGAFRATLADREIALLYGVLVAVVGAYVGWLVFLGAYVDARFAAAAALLGLVYVASGSVELVTNSLTPLVIRAVGAPAMALGGIALMAAPLLLSGLAARSVLAVVLTATAINVGSAAVVIGVNTLLLDRARAPGATMALASAANELGTAAGPLLAGWVLLASGDDDAANRVMGLLSLLGAALLLVGRSFWRVAKRRR